MTHVKCEAGKCDHNKDGVCRKKVIELSVDHYVICDSVFCSDGKAVHYDTD